jgi:hypothetical protein
VIVFPDVADASPPDQDFVPALQMRKRANGRKIIALAGILARRKGMLLMMDVARQAINEDWYFVFAGELALNSFLPEEQRSILDWVQSPPANCFFHFQRLPDEPQFNAIIDTCDILFAVYPHFLSSSNLLTKAAIFEKPIVVSDAYCMGERVRKYGLGATVAEDSAPQCIAAIRQLCDQLARDGHIPAARYQEYREIHSPEQLRVALRTLLHTANL